MNKRARPQKARRWVIKIGSAMVTAAGRGLDTNAIDGWVWQIARLRAEGREVVIVTSGAVAEGMARLGWRSRPHALPQLQAAAAVGQMGLVQAYESVLKHYNIHSAQILLTHEDLSDRQRYLNARATLQTLLGLGVIPVVNENDTVATDEIRFGDNDTLAALVANLIEADMLVILTDQEGLYSADPRKNPDAKLLTEVRAGDPALEAMASPEGGALGRGGMYTKVKAAERAARSGAATLIASGKQPDVLLRLAKGEQLGTLFVPERSRMAARKQWLASQLKVAGTLQVDEGAVEALVSHGCSLLPVGVRSVEGNFTRGDLVSVLGPDRREIARGLVNYSALETEKIRGLATDAIAATLGFIEEEELIHRDNLVLL